MFNLILFLCSISLSSTLSLARPQETITYANGLVGELIKALSTKEYQYMYRFRDYLRMSEKELNEHLETINEDGEQISYTLFAPESAAFSRQIPQDIADPFFQDSELRLKVLLRHFAKQTVTNELTKSEAVTLKMADSTTATLTRDNEGKHNINDAEIISHAIPVPGGFGSIYVVDRAFVTQDEVSESIAKFPSGNIGLFFPGTTEEAPTGDHPDLLDVGVQISTERTMFIDADAGGYAQQDSEDPTIVEMANFAAASISQTRNTEKPLSLVEVVSAKSQVVAGINYKLKINLNNPNTSEKILCDVLVFDRSWTKTRTLSSFSCQPQ